MGAIRMTRWMHTRPAAIRSPFHSKRNKVVGCRRYHEKSHIQLKTWRLGYGRHSYDTLDAHTASINQVPVSFETEQSCGLPGRPYPATPLYEGGVDAVEGRVWLPLLRSRAYGLAQLRKMQWVIVHRRTCREIFQAVGVRVRVRVSFFSPAYLNLSLIHI